MRALTASVGCLMLVLAAPAAAAPASLPVINRTLTADKAVKRSCLSAPDAAGPGVAVTRYTAPMAGFFSARLSAARSSDWDLVAINHANRRVIDASQGFKSNELVQGWTFAGQGIDLVACRRKGSGRQARVAISFLDVRPPAAGPKVSVVRVFASNTKLSALDAAGFDVTESRGVGWADVLVAGDAQRTILANSGLKTVTRIDDLDAQVTKDNRASARAAASGTPSVLPSGRTDYRNYPDVQAELKALVDKYPDRVRPIIIGKTFQGRDIEGVEIANNVKGDDGRPTYFLMGEHHAREWPSEEIAMEYATMLAKAGDARVTHLLDSERTAVVPVVNVDGFISTRNLSPVDPYDNVITPYGQGADQQSPIDGETAESVAPPGGILSYRRKNCDGAVPNGQFPCELQYGVDNNRNYGNLWGGAGASQDPTSQSFHGPSPRSEPETQAVWNYARTHQVTGLISLHTIAALVLRPPGLHTGGLSPDEAAMKELGDKMGAATGYTSEYGFQLYDTAGTTEDDTYAATGGYGYTIEIGPAGGHFHMAYETGVIQQWVKGDVHGNGGMREALLLMGEEVADTHHHAVISGSAPAGAKLTLSKSFDTATSAYCAVGIEPVVTVAALPDQLGCPNGVQDPQTLKDKIETTTTVPASGKFSWHVNQSTRPFVGGGAVIRELSKTPSREVTFTGNPASASNPPGNSYEDRNYTIAAGEHPDSVKIDVTWGTPEDYDLEVYRKNADGSLSPLGTSGNSPGEPEEVILSGDQVTPGNYVVRVVNFAGVTGTWTAKVGLYSTKETITTGHPEAYTLTCLAGGATVTRDVYIARGQTLAFDPCGTAAPAVVHPSPSGAPLSGPPTTGSSTPGSSTPGSSAPGAKPAKVPTKAAVRKAAKRCTVAKHAVRGKHGKAKVRARRTAAKTCAAAKKLAHRRAAALQKHG